MRAYTLFELLVALFIISLISSLIIPRFEEISFVRENFPEKVYNILLSARKKAYFSGKNILFGLDEQERRIVLAEILFNSHDLNSKIKIYFSLRVPEEYEIRADGLLESPPWPGVIFFASGMATPGEIEIVNKKSNQSLVISWSPTFFWFRQTFKP